MLNWGVIGLGRIAHRFVKSLSYFPEATFYGGASKNVDKRNTFNALYHPHILYDNYDDLLNDDNIDIVYIALPHKMHYTYAKKALLNGKCVLVEKPACLKLEEVEELISISKEKHLFFMEAMKSRFIPLNEIIKNEINKGIIGDIVSIENHFCYKTDYDKHSYLFDEIQGGALFDVGIYNLASIFEFINDDIVSIDGYMHKKYNVDVDDKIILTFKNGQKALFTCNFNENRKDMIIYGTKGKIILEPFYRCEKALIETDEESLTLNVKLAYDDFYPEIKEVHHNLSYINIESSKMSHNDSIKLIDTIEKIRGKLYE